MSASYVPQCTPGTQNLRRPLLVWGIALVVALFLFGLIVAAPLFQAHGQEFLSVAIYQAFSRLCHQIPERSLYVAGYPFAVCARCTGLYAGLTAGILFYPLVRPLRSTETPARLWLFVAAAPMAVDFSLGFFGIWENTHLSRFATGALLGAVAALYIVPGLVDLSGTNWRSFFKRDSAPPQSGQARAAVTSERSASSDYSWPSSRI